MSVKVLVADADAEARKRAATFLKVQGYQVFQADSGSAALDTLERETPHALVLDLALESPSALEVLAKLGQADEDITVLVTTDSEHIDAALDALKKGAYQYLIKPYHDNEMRALIEKGLEERQGKRLVKAMIAKLAANNARLLELSDLKSQFVGMVSHEMKNPLSAMASLISLVLTDQVEPMREKHRPFLEKTYGINQTVVDMIHELLDLTQIETGQVPLNLSIIDLGALARQVIDELGMQAEDQSVTFGVKADPETPEILADAGLMRLLLRNLVGNAIKYSPGGGFVAVHLAPHALGLRLTIKDRGVGMSEDDRKHLFQRFYRAPGVRDIPGTGLGLSIVKAILERHRGVIDVESAPGKGTAFKLTLPLDPADVVAIQRERENPS